MSSQEGRSPMDRKTAEELLRGDRAGHPLTELLAAAKAPATAGELSGEADALAAFRAAAQSPDVVPRRRRSMLAKLLTLKVAAAAFACTATVGGVALAASTGALPNPIGSERPSHSPSHSASRSPSASHAPRPSFSARPVPSGSALPDLCREWAGKDRDHRAKALDDAHFGELVKRAGKKDRNRVEQFCGLREPAPSGKPSARPSGRPGLPSGLPKTPQEQQQH